MQAKANRGGTGLEHPGFFENTGPHSLAHICEAVGAEKSSNADPTREFNAVLTLSDASPQDLSFIDNRKYLKQLSSTRAGAVLAAPSVAELIPDTAVALLTNEPYHAFARALALFYPLSVKPFTSHPTAVAGAPGQAIDPSARLEDGVVVEPGAVIGPEAHIGAGSRICSNAVIGYRCTVGRDCVVGPGVTMICTLMGDRVIVHGGVSIGQDGFGFAMGPQGHLKVPQIGRVIIQDDVEIGANTSIDRGALKDTIVGAGTKIDNLVQIGHNVVIGRSCVIVGQAGVAGSTELGDFVVIAGNAGVAGHLKVGTGAQIGGGSQIKDDVPPGGRYGGYPGRPLRQWGRELAALKRLAVGPARRMDEK